MWLKIFGAALLMTTTSNVDVDRITERLDCEVALTKKHQLQNQSHWRMVLIKEKINELHNEIPRLIQIHMTMCQGRKMSLMHLIKKLQPYRNYTVMP